MVQLLLLTLVSSTSVFLISAVQSFLSAAFIVSDCDECGFNDLRQTS